MNEDQDLEKLFANLALTFKRRTLENGRQELVWQKISAFIQNQKTRRQINRLPEKIGILQLLHFNKYALATLLVTVMLGLAGGATKVSEGSLPGETLYPLKKAAEKVEKVLATNQEAKVKVSIKHAKRRLLEVKTLVAEKKSNEIVAKTLEELKTTTEQVVVAASAAKPEALDSAKNFVAEETEVLTTIKAQIEGAVQEILESTLISSFESISKLKGSATKDEKVEGIATEEASPEPASVDAVLRPSQPKIKSKDGKLESEIQIHGAQSLKKENEESLNEPEILPEPTIGF